MCEPGSYCLPDGVRRECPAGRYGSTPGLNTVGCTGACAAGYYCPTGSTSSTQHVCGDSQVFCPIASAWPQAVYPGYYSVSHDEDSLTSANTRSAARHCEPGFYCIYGLRHLCLAGFYGDRFGQMTPQCSGACDAGYYCPEGSTSPTQFMCGDASRYCPVNSPHPLEVNLGFYSIGGNVSTRIAQLIAPRGAYASNGVLYSCPAGYYGAQEGLYQEQCSGRCDVPGYFCPSKSIAIPDV
jgi:hypothetical protein